MKSIIFVLPVAGYSGGANSVVQEVKGLVKLGIDARIAVNDKNISTFKQCYATISEVVTRLIEFNGYSDLSRKIENDTIVVATVGTQAVDVFTMVDQLVLGGLQVTKAYYIQDYEPLFFQEKSLEWEKVRQSYGSLDDVIAFAKTQWIIDVIKGNHNALVNLVSPSIDHDCYFPIARTYSNATHVTAMIRPGTPRRAPNRTARVLNKIIAQYDNVSVSVFGCENSELYTAGIILDPRVVNKGRLTREQVAQELRLSNLFIDASDFQAFGRTGIEAMACGAISIMPMIGGAPEFINHNVDGYIIDTRSDEEFLKCLSLYIEKSTIQKAAMHQLALSKASEFSVNRASASIAKLFI
ncbi:MULTISPECIES: glycosyltransferase [Cobetia]|uniref:glycosyltransferase n=1 Tax=Cobetia TaxID=204286 RepID=UPI0015834978|nr:MULTISPECIES: glycosyltransferase [Cobetia]MDI4661940.1 glycosyltransferase [Cobetia sp. BMC6]NUJ57916.1 glycosyltransferase [Cobetia marina]